MLRLHTSCSNYCKKKRRRLVRRNPIKALSWSTHCGVILSSMETVYESIQCIFIHKLVALSILEFNVIVLIVIVLKLTINEMTDYGYEMDVVRISHFLTNKLLTSIMLTQVHLQL